MKILFVHETFGATSGAEANLHLTARELKRRGHEVAILHGAGSGRDEPAWREAFATRFALPSTKSSSAVQSAIGRFEPDLVYLHKMADTEVLRALAAGEPPVARMLHDHEMYCLRGYRYHPVTRGICERAASWRCIFPCGGVLKRDRTSRVGFTWASYSEKQNELALNRCFDRFIVATAFMKQELLRNGFDELRISIHPPVTRIPAREELATFGDRNRIVYAGQVIRGKGVDVLLEALAQVRVPFECVIVGDGTHRPYCEELSRRLGLTSKVAFTGFVPQHAVRRFYHDCSLAVLSSTWPEPFGAAGLEAMLFGLPVVAFDVGGVSEWLTDGFNGRLVPPADAKAFAVAIESLLQDKAGARAMGARGRRFAWSRFNVGSYITRLERTFQQLVANRGDALRA